MRAVTRTKYGSPDVLELRDIDIPVPKEDRLLVQIHAASVNPLDWHILRGDPFFLRFMGYGIIHPKQRILGADIAGRVEAVGANVTGFKVGDEVFGGTLGGFAEYGCFPENKVALKPASITFAQAAAVPVAALTALQGLRDIGKLQAGQHLLVNGAAGGVGTFAVQIAKALGAEVTGVCSGGKLDIVRSIGADHVIDYTREDYTLSQTRYDLILDTAAYRSIRDALRVLKPTGKYVLVGGSMSRFAQSMWLKPFYSGKNGKLVTGVMAEIRKQDLLFVKQLIEEGKIQPVIGRTYSLSEVPEAIRHVEEGHATGKVIIDMRK